MQELHGFGIFGRNSFRMRSLLLIFCLLFVGVCNSQTTGTMTDTRDGKVYKTVVIGTQTWMAENLNVSTFRNGDPISEAKTKEEWELAGKEGKPAWCYYDNNSEYGENLGKLYNWYSVNDSRGLAPIGWHVPENDEWDLLTDYLGGNEVAGNKMKSTNGWSKRNGTNISGFSGLPVGGRGYEGTFDGTTRYGFWWTSTEYNSGGAWDRSLNSSNGKVYRYYNYKAVGLPVRCVRD